MRKSRVHVESHPSLNSKILIPSSLFSPAATSNLLNCTRGSQLPRNSCTLCHHCSSSMKPSVLMGEGDLYCHDYHPMAALVDQSKLIWLDGILKEQPDGSHQSQSVQLQTLIHFLFPEGHCLGSEGWCCTTELEDKDSAFWPKSIDADGKLVGKQKGCFDL